jgi:hypothetical protein
MAAANRRLTDDNWALTIIARETRPWRSGGTALKIAKQKLQIGMAFWWNSIENCKTKIANWHSIKRVLEF